MGGGEPPFTAVSPSTVTALASTTIDDRVRATIGARETARILIREFGRDQILRAIYAGIAAKQVGADLRQVLEERRIHEVTYADGKHVGLAQYADDAASDQESDGAQAGRADGLLKVRRLEVDEDVDAKFEAQQGRVTELVTVSGLVHQGGQPA